MTDDLAVIDLGQLEQRLDEQEVKKSATNVVPMENHEDFRDLRRGVKRARLKRLALRGITAKDAARIIGCSVQNVAEIYRDPEFRKEVMQCTQNLFADEDVQFFEKQKTMTEMLDEAAFESFVLLKNLLAEQDTSKTLKVKIAQDFLDRAESTSTKTTTIRKDGGMTVEAEALQRAAQAGREMDEQLTKKIRRVK